MRIEINSVPSFMITIPGKIPIRIHSVFWIISLLLGFFISHSIVGMFIWVGIIFISVLVHEFGHALAAISFGQTTIIDLIAFGGLTSRQGKKLSLWQEFIVVASGPLAGLLLSGLAYNLILFFPLTKMPLALKILWYFYEANLFWTFANLIPVLPLDGGHLLSIILQSLCGWKGIKIAYFLSMFFAGCGLIYCLFSTQYLWGSFFLSFMYENYQNWQNSRVLTKHDENDTLKQAFKEAENNLQMGLRQSALDKFGWVKDQTQTGMLNLSSRQKIAEIYVEQGLYSEAYEELITQKKRLGGQALFLLQWISYKLGKFEESAKIGKDVFTTKADYQTAFLNAQCNAKLGDRTATLGWLRFAIGKGLPNKVEMLKDQDFDFLREDEAFKSL